MRFAEFPGRIAAGSESAAAEGPVEARHTALYGGERAGSVPGAWQRVEQRLRVGVARLCEKRGRRRLFQNMTGIHHAHAVGHFANHPEIMRDEQQSHPGIAPQCLDQFEHLRLRGYVERSCGLVRDQQVRLRG